MLQITFADALVTMKTALNEGRLQFQNLPTNPTDREPDCEYRTNYTSEGKPIGCAWGVCFPDWLAEGSKITDIDSVDDLEILDAPFPKAAENLQRHHDMLVKPVFHHEITVEQATTRMASYLENQV